MIKPPFIVVIVILFLESLTRFTTVLIASADPDPELVTVPGLPPNIRVDARLTDIVRAMLLTSPTFRDQVRRLGRSSSLRVRVALNIETRETARTRGRAETIIGRYEFGLVATDVRLWSWMDVPELIAHELEHVTEYIEGMQFLMMATRPGGRVWVLSRGSIETGRAIDAGEHVARETAGWSFASR